MQTWNTIDKSEWPRTGLWNKEPDKAHWIDEPTGLDCLIVRGPSGALCGYVGVPETHQYYKVDYDKVMQDIYVHGGLTFSDICQNTEDESMHICHPKQGAANEHVWWFGFDCAHYHDICPKHDIGSYESRYRDFGYVKNETENLARQLSNRTQA